MKNRVKLLLSLDYEIFFGKYTGSVEQCLLKPTQLLVEMLNKHNTKVSLFVDAGFLLKLKQYGDHYPILATQYKQIKKQLKLLSQQGHDIQLHIHPHWQDSVYNGERWIIDSKRYRLHDFSAQEQNEIVSSYKQVLESCTEKKVFAFRAGGWCLQPFEQIKQALQDNQIWLDSTLFLNGFSDDPTRWINFKNMPKEATWNFDIDPLVINKEGYFTEVPISAIKISPLFFWKLAFHKIFSNKMLTTFGDGQAMISNNNYYFQRLSKTTYGPVMIDGCKAKLLEKAFKSHLTHAPQGSIFNVMGHPKSLTPDSLIQLELFIKRHQDLASITYQDLSNLKNRAQKEIQ